METDPRADRFDGRTDVPRPPLAELSPGTTVLVSGPPLIGKYELALDFLGRGHASGEAAVVVSTKDDDRTVVSDFDRTVPGFDRSRFGVVECVSGAESDGIETVESGVRVRRTASPGDLTGIGIGLSELMNEFDEAGASGVRVGMDSLSATMVYADFDRVCRFLHVLSNRIVRAGGIGLFTLDGAAVERSQYEALKGLFDGLVELRENDDGSHEYRIRGLDVPREWREYDPPGR